MSGRVKIEVVNEEHIDNIFKQGNVLELRDALSSGLNPNTVIVYSPLILLALILWFISNDQYFGFILEDIHERCQKAPLFTA
jgi:hypothetical protein